MMPSPPARVTRLELFSWILYDVANSSFTTLIVTVAYSVYFKEVVVGEVGQQGDFLWGLNVSLSELVVALSAPLLGAAADYSGRKKGFLALFTILCITFTALLTRVGPGDILSGMLFFILANIGFLGGLIFYDAFLPELAEPHRIGRVSGYGWAMGYFGGLGCLLAVLPLTLQGFGPEHLTRFRLSFLVVAGFFLVFSLPLFFFLRERAVPRGAVSIPLYVRMGFQRLKATLREIRRFRELVKFLVAYFLYNDAITTVIVFSSIFAVSTLGFTFKEVLGLFIATQVTAAAGAFGFGFLVDRFGPRSSISWTLLLWLGVVVGAFLVQSKAQYFGVALIAGLGIGSCQSASRSLMGLFAPASRRAEFYGFQAVSGRFSAILGPLVFGLISSLTGSQRLAVLSVGLFFLAGLLILSRVDEPAGIATAREEENHKG